MSFINMLQIACEKLTGRDCNKCRHNNGFLCKHPDVRISRKCRTGVFPCGFEKKEC